MDPIIISDEQKTQFDRDGFILIKGLLPTAMIDELRVGYDEAAAGAYEVDHWIMPTDPRATVQLGSPYRNIPSWLDHEYMSRVVAVGKQLLGDDIEYKYDQLIYKPPHSPVELLWHQDAGYGWGGKANERSLTCWLALSPVTSDMGTLQFLPGSHKNGIREHIDASHRNPINAALEVLVDASDAVKVEYEAGDATFHHGRTLHYSEGNESDRPRRGLSTHLWPTPNE